MPGTTTPTVEGRRIVPSCGIVTDEAILDDEVPGQGKGMPMVSASGTAVVLA